MSKFAPPPTNNIIKVAKRLNLSNSRFSFRPSLIALTIAALFSHTVLAADGEIFVDNRTGESVVGIEFDGTTHSYSKVGASNIVSDSKRGGTHSIGVSLTNGTVLSAFDGAGPNIEISTIHALKYGEAIGISISGDKTEIAETATILIDDIHSNYDEAYGLFQDTASGAVNVNTITAKNIKSDDDDAYGVNVAGDLTAHSVVVDNVLGGVEQEGIGYIANGVRVDGDFNITGSDQSDVLSITNVSGGNSAIGLYTGAGEVSIQTKTYISNITGEGEQRYGSAVPGTNGIYTEASKALFAQDVLVSGVRGGGTTAGINLKGTGSISFLGPVFVASISNNSGNSATYGINVENRTTFEKNLIVASVSGREDLYGIEVADTGSLTADNVFVTEIKHENPWNYAEIGAGVHVAGQLMANGVYIQNVCADQNAYGFIADEESSVSAKSIVVQEVHSQRFEGNGVFADSNYGHAVGIEIDEAQLESGSGNLLLAAQTISNDASASWGIRLSKLVDASIGKIFVDDVSSDKTSATGLEMDGSYSVNDGVFVSNIASRSSAEGVTLSGELSTDTIYVSDVKSKNSVSVGLGVGGNSALTVPQTDENSLIYISAIEGDGIASGLSFGEFWLDYSSMYPDYPPKQPDNTKVEIAAPTIIQGVHDINPDLDEDRSDYEEYGIYYPTGAFGLQAYADQTEFKGGVAISNITSLKNNATGVDLQDISSFENGLFIDTIEAGWKATGLKLTLGSTSADSIYVSNVHAIDSTAIAMDLDGGLEAGLIYIDNVRSDKDSVHGVAATNKSSFVADTVLINSVHGTEGDAYGLSLANGGEIETGVSLAQIWSDSSNATALLVENGAKFTSNTVLVNSVQAGGTATGIKLTGQSEIGYAQVANMVGKEVIGIAAEGNLADVTINQVSVTGATAADSVPVALVSSKNGANLSIGGGIITASQVDDSYKPQYRGNFGGVASADEFSVKQVALRSASGSTMTLGNSDLSGKFVIEGSIIAGNGSQDPSVSGGHMTINAGSGSGIYGDIYAGNGGSITLNLKDSVLVGQIDDYHELDIVEDGQTAFRNPHFIDDEGNNLEVDKAGEAVLTLNNSTWQSYGQSFVKSIVFEGNSTIDLTHNVNSSITIDNLSGSGEFTMRLANDPTKSNMLYVQNLDETAHYQVNVVLNPTTTRSIYELKDVRIATTKGNHQALGDHFSAVLTDQGVNNVTFKVVKEEFSSSDADNALINGEDNGSDSYKPGEATINEIFGSEDSTNWVIASTETSNPDEPTGPSTSLSDAGNALLATARGTYWTAVEIDRLTNRMGDARYANNGEDGLWIRLRQSRLGTDTGEGDFKSNNSVYQVGYDHAFRRESGRQLVGIAFDYMDTDLDYKGISGEGNTDRYGVTAYTTWLADNGFYIDVVGKWGRLDNDFDIINGTGGRVKADYDNNMWAISTEVGRKFSDPNSGMFIEPNAQLQYTIVTDAQYSTNQGTRVDQERIDSAIARAGVRIGRAFGETQSNTIYAKADMFREFLGEQKIHVKDVTTHVEGDTITVQNKGFWFDVGGGFQAQLGKNTYAYADVEYRWGNDLDKSWLVNAGARFEF